MTGEIKESNGTLCFDMDVVREEEKYDGYWVRSIPKALRWIMDPNPPSSKTSEEITVQPFTLPIHILLGNEVQTKISMG